MEIYHNGLRQFTKLIKQLNRITNKGEESLADDQGAKT